MQQALGIAAFSVVAGGMLIIMTVLAGPFVHRQVVVLRLRRGLHRIDEVLAGWHRDLNGGRRAPYDQT